MGGDTWTVYRHTTPSGKVYIGITGRPPHKRWGKEGYYYLNGPRRNLYFKRAILKYGWNNIKHEIVQTGLSKVQACELERALIGKYKEVGLCYNLIEGGQVGVLGLKKSEEARRKQSLLLREKWRTNPESFANRATCKGRKIPIEIRRKRSKPVLQFSLDGEFIGEYESIPDAVEATGISGKTIRNCCKGGYNCSSRGYYVRIYSAGGYKWRYKNAC